MGEDKGRGQCALCGSDLRPGLTNVPFVRTESMVIIKNEPAEICGNCHESYTTSRVTSRLLELVRQLSAVHAEVSVISYSEPETERPAADN